MVPKGTDEKFVAKLNQIFDENNATKSVYFTRQRRNPLDFTVRHFAGTYACLPFLLSLFFACMYILVLTYYTAPKSVHAIEPINCVCVRGETHHTPVNPFTSIVNLFFLQVM